MTSALLICDQQLIRYRETFSDYHNRYIALYHEINSKAIAMAQTVPDSGVGPNFLRDSPSWLSQIARMYRKHGTFARLLLVFNKHVKEIISFMELEMIRQNSQTGLDETIAHSREIHTRLREMESSCEALIHETETMKEGTSLLVTMTYSLISQRDGMLAHQSNMLNQQIANASRRIAEATSQDSSAMKALAVITMAFLPATAVAAILSMPVFQWDIHESWPVARRSIWVFCLLAIVLTAATLYVWRLWFLQMIWRRDLEYSSRLSHRGAPSEPSRSSAWAYPWLDQVLLRRHDRRREGRGDEDMELKNAGVGVS